MRTMRYLLAVLMMTMWMGAASLQAASCYTWDATKGTWVYNPLCSPAPTPTDPLGIGGFLRDTAPTSGDYLPMLKGSVGYKATIGDIVRGSGVMPQAINVKGDHVSIRSIADTVRAAKTGAPFLSDRFLTTTAQDLGIPGESVTAAAAAFQRAMGIGAPMTPAQG